MHILETSNSYLYFVFQDGSHRILEQEGVFMEADNDVRVSVTKSQESLLEVGDAAQDVSKFSLLL